MGSRLHTVYDDGLGLTPEVVQGSILGYVHRVCGSGPPSRAETVARDHTGADANRARDFV